MLTRKGGSLLSSLLKLGYTNSTIAAAASMSTTPSLPTYETLQVTRPQEYVTRVHLNRPEKRNAMNNAFWRDMVDCFTFLSTDPSSRCIVFTSEGPVFTAGLDLTEAAQLFFDTPGEDHARKAMFLKNHIKILQDSFTSIEKCPKPVIVAVQGACVGGGVDLITACDIRLCVEEAWFQIKEVDIGLAADVGTLQRISKIIGNESKMRELVYTARKFSSKEAAGMGLISDTFPDQQSMMDSALKMAGVIASKSPVAVQGSKVNLNYSRDHSVDESLDYAATWNMAMLQTEDIPKSVQAQIQKATATYSKL